MAVAENRSVQAITNTRAEGVSKGRAARRVLLAAGLAFPGGGLVAMGHHNLPAIERKMDVERGIVGSLKLAGESASAPQSTVKVGHDRFPVGFGNPNIELAAGNARVAQLQTHLKGGSEQIEADLEGVISQAPQVGRVPGDTAGIQRTIANDASQFTAEINALNGRRRLNLGAEAGGTLLGMAYPATVLFDRILYSRRKRKAINEAKQKANGETTTGLLERLTTLKTSDKLGQQSTEPADVAIEV